MRIARTTPAHVIAVLVHGMIAMLWLETDSSGVEARLTNTSLSSDRHRHSHTYNLLEWSPHLSIRDKQNFVRREWESSGGGVEGGGVACCPALLEMVEPEAGTDERGMFVELYRGDGDVSNRQRFYEVSCAPGVETRPCRFIDRRLYTQSRCVQRFSYSYAIVRRDGAPTHANTSSSSSASSTANFPQIGTGWMLGYIKVRSGCDCVLTPKETPPRAKKKPKGRKHQPKQHKIGDEPSLPST